MLATYFFFPGNNLLHNYALLLFKICNLINIFMILTLFWGNIYYNDIMIYSGRILREQWIYVWDVFPLSFYKKGCRIKSYLQILPSHWNLGLQCVDDLKFSKWFSQDFHISISFFNVIIIRYCKYSYLIRYTLYY